MGEIDTKPIDSVQTALSFFGQKADIRRNIPSDDEEVVDERKREMERLMKELGNVRVQLEAKDSAYRHSLLKLDQYHKTADELTVLLKKSDYQKDFYINECREAKNRIEELESALNQMAHQLSESGKLKEQLLHATNDLTSTRGRLLEMEAELASLRQAKLESAARVKELESVLTEEKLGKEELVRGVSEMNDIIKDLKSKAANALSEKQAELELAAKARERLELVEKRLEMMHDLENQVLDKTAYIDSLQHQLKQAGELQLSSEKAVNDAMSELNQIKEKMEFQKKKSLDQEAYIGLLETELKQVRSELENTTTEVGLLEDLKSELEQSKEKENDAQVEIALLKFEVHKGKSKLAAAEKENKALKETLTQGAGGGEISIQYGEANSNKMILNNAKDEIHVVENHNNNTDKEMMEKMKSELEAAVSKMVELRTRAEQAISRADAAEKAKTALEDEMKRRKEHRQRRKAALDALRSSSDVAAGNTTASNSSNDDNPPPPPPKKYQPLAKVLNMKF